MSNFEKEADAIRDEYMKKRKMADAFSDAVIAFLWLFVRLYIGKEKKAK